MSAILQEWRGRPNGRAPNRSNYLPTDLPAGRARLASLWGLANPRSRSQGDRRDKRPAYVSAYVHRKEGCRRREAATLCPSGLG